MKELEQFVVDYIEGRIETEAFVNRLFTDDSLFNWIQSILPDSIYYKHIDIFRDVNKPPTRVPYDIRTMVDLLWNGPGSKLGCKLDVHGTISNLYKDAFPTKKICVDETLKEKFSFMLDALPEYVGGVEAEDSGIFDKYIAELPEKASKSARIKMFRERLKKDFHLEGRKYPRWIQDPEWPFNNGKPMRFLYQKDFFGGELRKYYFEDVDTKEQRIVEQFY